MYNYKCNECNSIFEIHEPNYITRIEGCVKCGSLRIQRLISSDSMKLKKQYEQMARELTRGNGEVLGLLKTIEDIRNQIEKLSGWRIEFSVFKKQ